MKKLILFFIVLGLSVCLGQLRAQVHELPRAVPEAEGVPSEAVAALFDSLMALPQTEIHSVMVVRHGKVIGEIYPEPFAPEYRHTMYSCSKTFVGAAVGLAIEENRDIANRSQVFERMESRLKIAQTDIGRQLQVQSEDLRNLVEAFKAGAVLEDHKE